MGSDITKQGLRLKFAESKFNGLRKSEAPRIINGCATAVTKLISTLTHRQPTTTKIICVKRHALVSVMITNSFSKHSTISPEIWREVPRRLRRQDALLNCIRCLGEIEAPLILPFVPEKDHGSYKCRETAGCSSLLLTQGLILRLVELITGFCGIKMRESWKRYVLLVPNRSVHV